MYPQIGKLELAELLTFKYDHPPRVIGEDKMKKTFEEFFEGSRRELIQVEDEILVKE